MRPHSNMSFDPKTLYKMDNSQRLMLNQMIAENGTNDKTEHIRSLKHSALMRENVHKMIELKAKYADNMDAFDNEAMCECVFLHTYYTDIYNRIKKDTINLELLFNAFDLLGRVENGDIDCNDAEFHMGTLMKNMFASSAIEKADAERCKWVEPKPLTVAEYFKRGGK